MSAITILRELADRNILVSYVSNELVIEAPKGALTDEIIEKIKTNKPLILDFLQNQNQLHGYASAKPPIKLISQALRHDIPLSFSQQRLWLIDQINSGSAEYNLPKAVRIFGEFDIDLAERAITSIIQRHEILRTFFSNKNGEPVQNIRDKFQFYIERVDMSESANINRALSELLLERSSRAFDLTNDLMVRVTCFIIDKKRGAKQSVLLFNVHHIASDGWSTGILIKEFVQAYELAKVGNNTPFSPLSIQYADYAKWQREWLKGDVLDNQVSYWKKQLAEAPSQHSLPLDYSRPASKQYRGGVVVGDLDSDVSQNLNQASKLNKTTLFVVFHAALSLLLARHSNSNDIVIGTPVTNRGSTELDPLIGFFVNTLALRVNTNHKTFSEYLAHVKQVNREAQANQDLPFEQIIDLCRIERSINCMPLTQILLSVSVGDDPELSVSGLKFEPVESSEIIAKFDLELSVIKGEHGTHLRWTYDKSLFKESHITQLNRHLIELLHQIAEISSAGSTLTQLAELQLLSKDEIHFLEHELNQANNYLPTHDNKQQLLNKIFEKVAEIYAENIAVSFNEESLSYAELNKKSNRLAHFLRQEGVKQEEPIGLCLERSCELIIAMLAILKSGGAYVPIDPEWPTDRKMELVVDSGINKLIISKNCSLSVNEFQEKACNVNFIELGLSDFNHDFSGFSDDNLPWLSDNYDSQLAYVIYTSGSTGKPKGVMVEHGNVLQLVVDEPCINISSTDCITYCANPAFDASTWEVWGGLLNGAKLLVVSHDCLMDVDSFSQELLKKKATIVQLTAGLFGQYGPKMQPLIPQLNYLLWGGDKVDLAAVKLVTKNYPPKHLIHTYGPTETVAFTVTHEVEDLSSDVSFIPIGKHTSRSETYILDENLELVPFGAIGELYIGGAGVARGYLNQESLTHKKFVLKRFSNGSVKRLYRTGDLVRYSQERELIFIGRTDEQVKLRGFRIELGEVEYQLSQIDLVATCLAMIKTSSNNEKSLVAYVVPKNLNEESHLKLSRYLRDSLEKKLPDFMVPSLFIIIDKFPLTANGKVDRNKLLQIEHVIASVERTEPKNIIEKQLASVWSDLLGLPIDGIDTTDSFFSLGGNSLRIAQLGQKINDIFGIKLNYRVLFQRSCILSISQEIIRKLMQKLSAKELLELADANSEKILLNKWRTCRKIILTMNLPYTRSDGGANKSNRILAESFAALGYKVRVITPALAVPSDISIEQLAESIKSQGVNVTESSDALHFEINGVCVDAVKQPERLRYRLKQSILEIDPDWVFVSAEDSSQLILSAALDVAEDRVVYFAHTPQMLPFGDQSFYPGEKRKSLIAKAKIIVTISQYVADYIRRDLEHPNIFINHPPHYGSDFVKLANFQKKYILCVNPCEVKGIKILVELAKKHMSLTFAYVASWGTTASDLELLNELPNVVMIEKQSDLNKLFEEVKVLLVPSLWGEGFGMIVVDAMLRGIPVVASNVGGLREAKMDTNYLIEISPIKEYSDELNENYIPRAKVPEQDVVDWSRAIEELTSSEEMYIRSSTESYDKAVDFVSTLGVEPLHQKLEAMIYAENRQVSVDFMNDKLVDSLSSDFVEDLVKSSVRKNSDVALFDILKNVPDKDLYEVSYSQQQLLLLDKMNTGYYGFILNSIHPLGRNPDYAKLEEAINQVCMRHDAFRTYFVSTENGFKQKVNAQIEFDLKVEVLESVSTETEAKAHIQSFFNQPFDLYKGPLFRIKVVEFPRFDEQFLPESSSRGTVLLVSMHHIISDRASMETVVREVFSIYEGLMSNEPVKIEPLRFQYKEFAEWQVADLDKFSSLKAYWSQKLAGNISKLELPIDFRRKAIKSYNGLSTTYAFSEALSQSIVTLARSKQSTSLIVLMTIIKTLLFKYCNEGDVVVGIPASGRTDESLNNQVGFYINMLPIRDLISENDKFSELLEKVKTSSIEAYDNQLYPFSLMIEDNPGSYDPSRSPIFDVMVSLDSVNQKYTERENELVEYQIDAGSSHDISFLFTEYSNRIVLKVTYDRSLYRENTICRLIEHLVKIAAQVCLDDQISLSKLELLTSKEKLIVEGFNQTQNIRFDNEVTLHKRFVEIAKKYPQKQAVVCGLSGETLTYEVLNHRVNKLANKLVSLGVNQKTPVAILLSESIESVIAILAVLKSGSFYLPISPAYPTSRIIDLLEVALPKVILYSELLEDKHQHDHSSAYQSLISEGVSKNSIFLNLQDSSISLESNFEPEDRVNAEDLAYVLFTSGTTAKPKGVMVKHSNVTRLFFNDSNLFSFDENDVWTMFHSTCFDFSVWELFGALLFGGKLIVVSDESRADISALLNTIEGNQVTVLNQVPNVFYNLISTGENNWSKFSSLRYVIFGGDKLEPAKLSVFKKKHPAVKLINMYGITETAIHTTYKEIFECDIESGISNIGTPLPTVSLYVLDSSMNLLPDNAIGELYVGGAGLANGYLKDKELTKNRFIDNALADGGRLYRTGDLARRLSSGEYEYLGRIDNQVNIRGFRVGLAEIECQISKLESIEQAVVVVKQDGVGNHFLSAFVVEKASENKGALELGVQASYGDKVRLLRRQLSGALPNYMLPSVFTWIAEIPLTSNGKVDRKYLSQMPVATSPSEAHGKSILNASDDYLVKNSIVDSEVQQKLLLIWSRLLNTNAQYLGLNSNFFELGGHSLLLVKMSTEIRSVFSVELPIKEIMEVPFFGELSQIIEQKMLAIDVRADHSEPLAEDDVEIEI